MPFDIPILQPVSSLYFIGDSNALVYRYLTIDLPAYFPRPIVTNCCFVPGLSAASVLEGEELTPQIVNFLRREMIFDSDNRLRRLDAARISVEDRTWRERAGMPQLHDINNQDPSLAVVLMLGSVDLATLLRELGTNVDFPFEDPHYTAEAFSEPELPLIPLGAVASLVARRVAPIGKAIALLRAMGYDVYLHNIHPPSPDDIRYYRLRHTMSSAKVRYKLAVVMNRELEGLAARAGAHFLNVWPLTLVDGLLDPALDLDGDHLNRDAARITMRALLNDIVARRGVPATARRRT